MWQLTVTVLPLCLQMVMCPGHQGDVPLAEWLVCMTCSPGVLALKPVWALGTAPH